MSNAILARLWRATVGRSELLRFVIVGGVGFLVDAGVLMALTRGAGLDPYSGRVVSFVAASSTTWWLNRIFTFTRAARHPVARQWASFVVVSIGGALINYGVYVATLQSWPLALQWPVLGVAFGSLAGLCFNFPAAKLLVFRTARADPSRGNSRS
jgi:putative flippase GtrA